MGISKGFDQEKTTALGHATTVAWFASLMEILLSEFPLVVEDYFPLPQEIREHMRNELIEILRQAELA